MLNIFTLANGRLFQEEIESLEELSQFQPIWVDLESPTVEEKRWVDCRSRDELKPSDALINQVFLVTLNPCNFTDVAGHPDKHVASGQAVAGSLLRDFLRDVADLRQVDDARFH